MAGSWLACAAATVRQAFAAFSLPLPFGPTARMIVSDSEMDLSAGMHVMLAANKYANMNRLSFLQA
jgi:hypothetical protein